MAIAESQGMLVTIGTVLTFVHTQTVCGCHVEDQRSRAFRPFNWLLLFASLLLGHSRVHCLVYRTHCCARTVYTALHTAHSSRTANNTSFYYYYYCYCCL
jgi:hypothetical protein